MQTIPVRVYSTADRIMVAAPMPGLEPQDISVEVEGTRVIVHGEERGAHQHDIAMDLEEWAVGPYHRELDVPQPVNGALANATYGNGVLVVTLPKAETVQPQRVQIRLERLDPTRGAHVGHTGRRAKPVADRKHRRSA